MKYALFPVLCVMAFLVGYLLGRNSSKPQQPAERIVERIVEVEKLVEIAVEVEKKVIEYRPIVTERIIELEKATETRIEAGITLDTLPEAFLPEWNAMHALIDSQAIQLAMEIQRGDAWKEALERSQELVRALQEHMAIAEKRSWKKGFSIGAGSGASVVLLLVLL